MRRLTLLLAEDVASQRRRTGHPQALPYRLDHLSRLGWDVESADPYAAARSGRSRSRLARALSRLGPPAGPTLTQASRLVRGSDVLAVFESEGHFLALLRALIPPMRRGRHVIVVCWLSELLPQMSPARRRLLRFAYRGVDAVVCFSPNQVPVLTGGLGVRADQVHPVPFGIDTGEFPVSAREEPYLLAVGRDRGRDWGATFAAVRDCPLPLKVLCRPDELTGTDVPPGVEVLGYVSRETYRELLAGATAVLLLTRELAYPTGQTVLLEAMSNGKVCVVTDTPAMHDYLDAAATIGVPVGDVGAARAALDRVLGDPQLRRQMGVAAAQVARERYDATVMCGYLDRVLRG